MFSNKIIKIANRVTLDHIIYEDSLAMGTKPVHQTFETFYIITNYKRIIQFKVVNFT